MVRKLYGKNFRPIGALLEKREGQHWPWLAVYDDFCMKTGWSQYFWLFSATNHPFELRLVSFDRKMVFLQNCMKANSTLKYADRHAVSEHEKNRSSKSEFLQYFAKMCTWLVFPTKLTRFSESPLVPASNNVKISRKQPLRSVLRKGSTRLTDISKPHFSTLGTTSSDHYNCVIFDWKNVRQVLSCSVFLALQKCS